jgi:hypothetical protein
MQSKEFKVSYPAVGIFAHLCSDGIEDSSNKLLNLNTILDEIVSLFKFVK